MVVVFELGGREVAEGGMAALAVVEGLDVLEDGGPGLPVGERRWACSPLAWALGSSS